MSECDRSGAERSEGSVRTHKIGPYRYLLIRILLSGCPPPDSDPGKRANLVASQRDYVSLTVKRMFITKLVPNQRPW